MKVILQHKKGISEIIAYVLLISLTISLSVMVYAWLKLYVNPSTAEECPEGVNVIVVDYTCVPKTSAASGHIDVTLKNKGMFTVNGYILRVSDKPDANIGIYTLTTSGQEMVPGNSSNFQKDVSYNITYLEVQPFVNGKKNSIQCEDFTTLKVNCA